MAITVRISRVTMSGVPSPRSEALIRLFHNHPELAVEILYDLMGVHLPAHPATLLEPVEGDDVVLVMGPRQAPAHAIIVTVPMDGSRAAQQLARDAAALWLRLGCDITVLFVCPDHGLAVHYARSIESGLTGYRFQAQVLGPYSIPDSAVLSPEMWRLEELMKSASWPAYSPFTQGRLAESRAATRREVAASILLLSLGTRGIEVPDDLRALVVTCTDVSQLNNWLVRAASARALDDVFSSEHLTTRTR
jgi:hypothetical protein